MARAICTLPLDHTGVNQHQTRINIQLYTILEGIVVMLTVQGLVLYSMSWRKT